MAQSVELLKRAALMNSLRSCQLFAGLSGEDLQRISDLTAVRTLDRGAYLFREGEPAHGFYVVQSGAINVHRVTASGKEQVIHIFRPGESLAEAALANDLGYPAYARAVEPSQVLLVQKTGFVALLRSHPELPLRMLAAMSGHLRVLVGQLEELTLHDVETRLAHWLLKRCPKPHDDVPHTVQIEGTKRVLAAELGTVGETLSRTLAHLRDEGLITVDGQDVTVLKPASLDLLLQRHLGG